MSETQVAVKLSEIAEIRPGYPIREGLSPKATGDYRVVQIKDIKNDGTVDADSLYSTNLGSAGARYAVSKGDVFVPGRGARNVAAHAAGVPENTVASSHLFTIRPVARVLSEYLVWFLNQAQSQAYFKSRLRGSYTPLLPRDAVTDMAVYIPSLEVQRKIVAIEGLRRKEEHLTRTIANKRSALVQAICLNAAKTSGKGERT